MCLVAKLCLTLCSPMDCIASVYGISQQEYWSGLPFPPPGDLPDPGMELESPATLALVGALFTTESPRKPKLYESESVILSVMSDSL